ncbi:unnamed protein product [Polarella glacialis]|uniref:Receptor ligand binding region domain-containing protein n=1 Tax=Polarella glacialis TaxID=89957 RepID=A0A813KTR4_POLGL|nr:unnamed protein product [Polarella glacialis]
MSVRKVGDSFFSDTGLLFLEESFLFDAAYTFVLAVNDLLNEGNSLAQIKGPVLLAKLKKASFEGITGQVSFNAEGDRLASYQLVNMQPVASWICYSLVCLSCCGLWCCAVCSCLDLLKLFLLVCCCCCWNMQSVAAWIYGSCLSFFFQRKIKMDPTSDPTLFAIAFCFVQRALHHATDGPWCRNAVIPNHATAKLCSW